MLQLTVSRPVSVGVKQPSGAPIPDFYYCQTVAGLLMWSALSDEKTGRSFTITAGPRHRSQSRVRLLRDSWPYFYFTVSDSRISQPGGPGHRIYIAQAGGPVIPTGTGFPFHRLLRQAGLRWRHSHQPPRGAGDWIKLKSKLRYDRRSVGQSVSVSSRIWGPRPDFCYCQTVDDLFMWGALFLRDPTE
jgi:hypothetical protein